MRHQVQKRWPELINLEDMKHHQLNQLCNRIEMKTLQLLKGIFHQLIKKMLVASDFLDFKGRHQWLIINL